MLSHLFVTYSVLLKNILVHIIRLVFVIRKIFIVYILNGIYLAFVLSKYPYARCIIVISVLD